jgi:hypothetical protein
VIYTDNESVEFLKQARRKKPIQIIPIPLWNNSFSARYKDNYTTFQYAIDPEKDIHHPELYAIWNSKVVFLKETAESNPFQSEFFLWVDVGSFRANRHVEKIFNWPDPTRVEEILSPTEPSDTMLLGLVTLDNPGLVSSWNESMGPIYEDMIQGGFFGGKLNAIQWWYNEFYRLHDVYLERGFFVGKEQNLMNTLAILNKHRVKFIDASHYNCCDRWFFFLQVLSMKEERSSDYRMGYVSRLM